jgi:DNA-binding MarR family transcriptional regulator
MVKSVLGMGSTISARVRNTPRVRLSFSDGLYQLLARTDHIVAKSRTKELRQYGITMNDAIVLFTAIRLKRQATPANISRQLFWEPHTVSEQLKAMEAKGLIKKVRDLERQNFIRVQVTEDGLKAYRDSSRRKSTRKVMSALSHDEQVQLWALLAKIRQRAMQELGLDDFEPFPPSDPNDF